MDSRLISRNEWDTGRLALYGTLPGIFLAMMEQFCHAFCPASWRHTPGDNLFAHVVVEVVIGALAGATVFAAVSATRNWLVRERYSGKRS